MAHRKKIARTCSYRFAGATEGVQVPRHPEESRMLAPRQHSSSERLRISGSRLLMIAIGSLAMALLLMPRP